jgi:hypothetical protein
MSDKGGDNRKKIEGAYRKRLSKAVDKAFQQYQSVGSIWERAALLGELMDKVADLQKERDYGKPKSERLQRENNGGAFRKDLSLTSRQEPKDSIRGAFGRGR